MSVRTRDEKPLASRLHQVLTLGMNATAAVARKRTPTGALEFSDLPQDIIALIAAFLADANRDGCIDVHRMCNFLRSVSRGFDLCAFPGFWRAAYRMLINLPAMSSDSDPQTFGHLPPHVAKNWRLYRDVDQQPNVTGVDKWKRAFEQECGRAHTNDTIVDAVNWCRSNDNWVHFKYGHVNHWRVGRVTNMSSLFRDGNSSQLDLAEWDTSNVTNMSSMFAGTPSNYVTGDPTSAAPNGLEQWDVSKVEAMESMFTSGEIGHWNDFNKDISGWNTRSCQNFKNMFWMCSQFNRDLGNWNVSQARDMESMFEDCNSFEANLGRWNVGRCTNFRSMFATGSPIFHSTGVEDRSNLGLWNVSAAENLQGMFEGRMYFKEDLSAWQTGNVQVMAQLFKGCESFNCDLGRWNVSKVTDMSDMFSRCNAFNGDLRHWDVSQVTKMPFMFAVRDGQIGYQRTNSLRFWDVSSLRDAAYMFHNCRRFNDDLSHWNVSSLQNSVSMFEGCALFNANLSHWDVSSVIECRRMFAGCAQFTATLAHWDLRAYWRHRYHSSPNGLPPDFHGPDHRRLWTTNRMIETLGFGSRGDDAEQPPMPRLPQDRADVAPLPPLPPLPEIYP